MNMDEISAHLEIRQALVRYCRGVDRGDATDIASAYHPEALDRHGAFAGPIDAFIPHVLARFDEPGCIGQHHMTNVYVELNAASARVESYFLTHRVAPNSVSGRLETRSAGGRYLDQFQLRNGSWKIVERDVIIDWASKPTADLDTATQHGYLVAGRRASDPSADMFKT
jgi:hypothetical protein